MTALQFFGFMLAAMFILGTFVFIYGLMTAEENNDPDEWDN